MSIGAWKTPEEERFIRTRKEVRRVDAEEAARAKSEKESAELWVWYESQPDKGHLSDSFRAAEHARELKAAAETKEEIRTQLMITELNQFDLDRSEFLAEITPDEGWTVPCHDPRRLIRHRKSSQER